MATKVCLVCCEHATTTTDRNANLVTLIKSPEFEVTIYNIPSADLIASGSGISLPTADFYLDCMSATHSAQLARVESVPLARLCALTSWGQSKISKSLLEEIRKNLQDRVAVGELSNSDMIFLPRDSDDPEFDAHCQSRLDVYGQEKDLFSAMVFASAGSKSVLAVAELGRSDRPATIRDQASATLVRNLVNSILDRPAFTKLDGCLRVDISISNITGTITSIQIDLEPRIFDSFAGSLDDWMVTQSPSGHEALLCLILTSHQQSVKGVTAKQASVTAAFDIISSQLASTFDHIAHVAVMRSIAYRFDWEGAILDVGCGQGVFGDLLATYHSNLRLYGTDMTDAMTRAPLIAQHYQSPISIGPMERTLIASPAPDHITCFSVFQYVTPMTFIAALEQMFLQARRSITFDIPEVSPDYARMLEKVPKLSRPTDHLASLERFGTPTGWRMVMHRHCLTYTEPNYNHDLYSRYIRFEKVVNN